MYDGVLYRVRENPDGEKIRQLILPEKYQREVMKSLHDDTGHLGIERTTELVRERFYWPHLANDVMCYVKTCGRCVRRKGVPESHTTAPLVNIKTSRPLELVCMDYLTLEESKGGYSNILVITDHFTHYTVAVPTRNQTAHYHCQSAVWPLLLSTMVSPPAFIPIRVETSNQKWFDTSANWPE